MFLTANQSCILQQLVVLGFVVMLRTLYTVQ